LTVEIGYWKYLLSLWLLLINPRSNAAPEGFIRKNC
jgi:hypothetical protein